jgi:hypothetical protein
MNIQVREGQLSNEIAEAVKQQPIFWSDDRNEHFMFDFKVGAKWVSSVKIENDFSNMIIDVL